MAISKKPNAQKTIESVINKGGSVTGEKKDEKRMIPIILYVPYFILQKIEEERIKSPLKKSRNLWILETLLEKVEK